MTSACLWAGKRFSELVLDRGFGAANGVYTFNTEGLGILRDARAKGLAAVMEQTIAPVEVEDRLLLEEADCFRGWTDRPRRDGFRSDLAALERAEWNEADTIVCGSEFVAAGIRKVGGPWEKCAVVPYGVDCHRGRQRARGEGPLRVLFVGGIRLRKGVQYLAEAGGMLPSHRFEFRLVGPIGLMNEGLRRLREHVQVMGPTPRSEMAEHWEWADVFVLPSLCEGSATVCYEAMGAGLPVVTTPNAGSVVRDGVEGFIVPIRDAEAIADRLDRLATEAGLLEAMSEAALKRAEEFTVAEYGKRLLAEVCR